MARGRRPDRADAADPRGVRFVHTAVVRADWRDLHALGEAPRASASTTSDASGSRMPQHRHLVRETHGQISEKLFREAMLKGVR